jgi:hypothetical protein
MSGRGIVRARHRSGAAGAIAEQRQQLAGGGERRGLRSAHGLFERGHAVAHGWVAEELLL